MIEETAIPGNIILSPGETVVKKGVFAFSILLFFLHLELVLTDRRIAGRAPNTMLGLIPVGSREVNYPLSNISGIGTSIRFRPIAFIVGLLIILSGLAAATHGFTAGIVYLLVGVLVSLNSVQAVLTISNNAGANIAHRISPLEMGKAREFAQVINTTIAARG